MNPHTQLKTGRPHDRFFFLAQWLIFMRLTASLRPMPELPEVETILRGVAPRMKGARLQDVVVRRADLRMPLPENFAADLRGRCVGTPFRRGKYMLFPVEGTHMLVVHLGMSGHLGVAADGQAYEPRRHDHVIFCLEQDDQAPCQIVFHDPRRFGFMTLLPFANWRECKPFDRMGPEPLSDEFDGQRLYESLFGRQGPIKTVLLDQGVVAGIGNIYACEALYAVRIHPAIRACDLTEQACADLVRAIKAVLNAALKSGGSTLRDYRGATGESGYFQHDFKVYGRADQSCLRRGCKGVVERMIQSGRSSFFCPSCTAKVAG